MTVAKAKVKAPSIKITNAALDTVDGKELILRGSIDPDSFDNLLVGPYQREVLPLSTLTGIEAGYECGSVVPAVDLGQRGDSCVERNGAFYLSDPIYIIDGLQRISAGKRFYERTGKNPRIGCTIRFDTNEIFERNLFKILNSERSRVSPNILMRNLETEFAAVDMLRGLCDDTSFALNKRVSWNQNMGRHEILTGLGLGRVCGYLHTEFGPGKSANLQELCASLTLTMNIVGRVQMRENMKTFFDVIDKAWGIRTVVYKSGANYLRSSFLTTFADFITRHENFWDGKKLVVADKWVKKLAKFPIMSDPTLISLVATGGQAGEMLYNLLAEYMNGYLKTDKLRSRPKKSWQAIPNRPGERTERVAKKAKQEEVVVRM